VVTKRTVLSNIEKFLSHSRECIHVFHMILRINIGYFRNYFIVIETECVFHELEIENFIVI
jgi:hypothetical protein